MNISFERTGGFAGMRLSTMVDTHSLDADEADRLEHEVREAAFFSLPPQIYESGGGVDRFEYQIVVEWEEQRHSIVVGETAMPETLRPLVEHLERLLRTRRPPRDPA